MATNENNLTHDEIWDDSALVESWNEALEEYKKYHSIHTKGGNVNDLIEERNTSDAKVEPEHPPQRVDSPADKKSPNQRGQDVVSLNVFPPDPGENLDGSKTSFVVKPHRNLINAQSMGVENGTGGIRLSHSPAAGPASVPAGLLGTVHDEGLKRLLMSWYYAGYYTGYYEGQRETVAK